MRFIRSSRRNARAVTLCVALGALLVVAGSLAGASGAGGNPASAAAQLAGYPQSDFTQPWALQQFGFRALIAPSYADIFFNNCFKNGLLPIVLSEHEVAGLFDEAAAFIGYKLTIDLERQVVVRPDGSTLGFQVEPFRKYCLLGGYDDIALTLRHADTIRAFEAERLLKQPWLATTVK